jgi:WD40 repeat protein
MSSRNRQHLLVAGVVALLLSSIWISCLDDRGNRPDQAGDSSRTLTGHTHPVQALAFSPNGDTLTTVAYFVRHSRCEAEVAVWEVQTGQATARAPQTLENLFPLLAVAPNGRSLVAVQDHSLWRWDIAFLQGRQLYTQHANVCAMACSSDGGRLAVADFANVVTLVDTTSGQPRARCQGHVEPVVALAFTPDGTALASGARDGSVRLWDAATGEGRGTLRASTQRGLAESVQALAFGPEGKTLASGTYDGTIRLWDVASLRERTALATTGEEAAAVAFSPDGRTLAATMGPVVQLWDVDTGRHRASLVGHQGKVKCLAFSPDGTRLASGSYDRTVRLWNVAE